jgi:lipoprotein-anchoring transpeptidase ErfK/SrfK
MSYEDWQDLLAFAPQEPKSREDQPDRVEVDIGRQVLYLILGGEIDAIVHVSTGYDPDDTPRTTTLPDGGYFWYQHPYNGWSPKPGAWSIYKFWAYKAGSEYNYGVHGYLDVPYWPASHGCTRVHVWDADYLHPRIFVNMPAHVWDE